MAFARWMARPKDIVDACAACQSGHENRKQEPPCEGCEYSRPGLTDRNMLTVWVMGKMGGSVTDGMGGFNASSVEAFCRMLGVNESERAHIAASIARLIAMTSEARRDGTWPTTE